MDPICSIYREELLATALASAPAGGHRDACPACAAWARGVSRQSKALRELPRQLAPFELDGLVVAALGAGQRQARATRAVSELLRVQSPAELAEAVDSELDAPGAALAPEAGEERARLHAPAVLDRLVEEELADPVKARVSRYLGSLRRRRAPSGLVPRLAHALEQVEDARSRPARRALWGGLALASGVLLAWFGSVWLDRGSGGPEPRAGYDFAIERVSSSAGLSPMALGHLDGLSGGLRLAGEL